jgi:hypothetical protein
MPPRSSSPIDAFSADSRIDEQPSRTTTIRWHEPVFSHADRLVDEARSMRTSRAEIAAALIATTPADRALLLTLVSTFRDSRVLDLGSPLA